MSVGQRIADARSQRGMTVADVAAATRIRTSIINRIEADDFADIDAEVFVRSYIRSIAASVGLDPDEITDVYIQQTGAASKRVQAPIAASHTDIFAAHNRETLPPKSTVRGRAIIWAALIVVVVLALFKLASARGHASTAPDNFPQVTTAAPSSDSTDPTSQSTDNASSTDSPAATSTAAAGEVSIDINMTGDSKLTITSASGAVLFDATANVGSSLHFVARGSITVIAGNPSAVTVSVNGTDLGPVADGNATVTRTYTAAATA